MQIIIKRSTNAITHVCVDSGWSVAYSHDIYIWVQHLVCLRLKTNSRGIYSTESNHNAIRLGLNETVCQVEFFIYLRCIELFRTGAITAMILTFSSYTTINTLKEMRAIIWNALVMIFITVTIIPIGSFSELAMSDHLNLVIKLQVAIFKMKLDTNVSFGTRTKPIEIRLIISPSPIQLPSTNKALEPIITLNVSTTWFCNDFDNN
ncbi:hypothetical protein FF38_05781 [Lucilia cuprina]|uniref:Uncharacterized protein n=1 Tax=Lucilia cuprina TaxID=7375 RepID=A0A0L0C7V6_LUCCU|nr:hypothetical protein FF38_05781 [Lucilia cuprina]